MQMRMIAGSRRGDAVRPRSGERRDPSTPVRNRRPRRASVGGRRSKTPDRAVYRYRVAIVSLLELKPGMTAADVGAGSGFIARLMAPQVAPGGKVIATELDPALVSYINDRAHADNLQNLSARLGQPAAAALDPSSVDAHGAGRDIQRDRSAARAAAIVVSSVQTRRSHRVVDSPREGQGTSQTGIDADDVVAIATAAGLTSDSTRSASCPDITRFAFGSLRMSMSRTRRRAVLCAMLSAVVVAVLPRTSPSPRRPGRGSAATR